MPALRMERVMSITEYPLARAGGGPAKSGRLGRPLRAFAAAAAALAALSFLFASEPPGQAVRGDLAAAAARLGAMPETASPARVASDLVRDFSGEDATVDPAQFPAAVTVTLHGLDRNSCKAALRSAQRIEGRVVVELENRDANAQCGERNDLTWRLMP
jgi:hypothetical protein